MRIALLGVALFLLSCKENIRTRDNGTRLNSKDYPNKEERLAVFNNLFSTHTSIKDVEFDLFNVNGFGNDRSILGPSSRCYKYVVKVNPADTRLWTDFLPPINLDTSFAWHDSLISLRKDQWSHTSAPLYFGQKDGLLVTVYKPEGLIFREVCNN